MSEVFAFLAMLAAAIVIVAVVAWSGRPKTYRCTHCGQNEIEARANSCGQKDDDGPCPMELI